MFTVVKKSVETNPRLFLEITNLRRNISSPFISVQKKQGYSNRVKILVKQLNKFTEKVQSFLNSLQQGERLEICRTTSIEPIRGELVGYRTTEPYFIIKDLSGKSTYIGLNTVYSIKVLDTCNHCRKEFPIDGLSEGLCVKCEEDWDGI